MKLPQPVHLDHPFQLLGHRKATNYKLHQFRLLKGTHPPLIQMGAVLLPRNRAWSGEVDPTFA